MNRKNKNTRWRGQFQVWEAVLLLVLLIVILAIAFSMPGNPLGVPCMDAWCK
jgi:hypothetical protein